MMGSAKRTDFRAIKARRAAALARPELRPTEKLAAISTAELDEAIAAGKSNCTVECNPLLGPTVFDTLEAIRAGKTPEKKIIMKDQVFDQSNAKEALPNRKY